MITFEFAEKSHKKGNKSPFFSLEGGGGEKTKKGVLIFEIFFQINFTR